jgi:hypothetical protein
MAKFLYENYDKVLNLLILSCTILLCLIFGIFQNINSYLILFILTGSTYFISIFLIDFLTETYDLKKKLKLLVIEKDEAYKKEKYCIYPIGDTDPNELIEVYKAADALIKLVKADIKIYHHDDKLPDKAREPYSLGYLAGYLEAVASIHIVFDTKLIYGALRSVYRKVFGDTNGTELFDSSMKDLENDNIHFIQGISDGSKEFEKYFQNEIGTPLGWLVYVKNEKDKSKKKVGTKKTNDGIDGSLSAIFEIGEVPIEKTIFKLSISLSDSIEEKFEEINASNRMIVLWEVSMYFSVLAYTCQQNLTDSDYKEMHNTFGVMAREIGTQPNMSKETQEKMFDQYFTTVLQRMEDYDGGTNKLFCKKLFQNIARSAQISGTKFVESIPSSVESNTLHFISAVERLNGLYTHIN